MPYTEYRDVFQTFVAPEIGSFGTLGSLLTPESTTAAAGGPVTNGIPQDVARSLPMAFALQLNCVAVSPVSLHT